jgi:hypothetical protein
MLMTNEQVRTFNDERIKALKAGLNDEEAIAHALYVAGKVVAG